MVNAKMIPLMLRLFDGEGGGAEGGQAEGNLANSTADAQQVADASAEQTTDVVDLDAEFNELIKGKYKDAYGKKFKEGMDKRFKGHKETEQRLKDSEAVLQRVAEMTGNADISDLANLMSRLDDIDPHLEQEAIERGIPIETLRDIKRIERQNAEYQKAEQQRQADIQAQQQMQEWLAQADECVAMYGDNFNLDTELMNDEFKGLLEAGYPMRKAFEVVHLDEMVGGAMQFAARTTQTNIANDIRARGTRPSENGMHSNAPIRTSVDINSLSNAEMDIINQKIQSGEVRTPADIAKYLKR